MLEGALRQKRAGALPTRTGSSGGLRPLEFYAPGQAQLIVEDMARPARALRWRTRSSIDAHSEDCSTPAQAAAPRSRAGSDSSFAVGAAVRDMVKVLRRAARPSTSCPPSGPGARARGIAAAIFRFNRTRSPTCHRRARRSIDPWSFNEEVVVRRSWARAAGHLCRRHEVERRLRSRRRRAVRDALEARGARRADGANRPPARRRGAQHGRGTERTSGGGFERAIERTGSKAPRRLCPPRRRSTPHRRLGARCAAGAARATARRREVAYALREFRAKASSARAASRSDETLSGALAMGSPRGAPGTRLSRPAARVVAAMIRPARLPVRGRAVGCSAPRRRCDRRSDRRGDFAAGPAGARVET